jgi:hypothetical protein
LCKTGASEQVHAAVQLDTQVQHDGSIRYEISEKDWQGTAHRVVIQRLNESDSGNPRVLRNFLAWGFARYSAEKYLAVVWNHVSGAIVAAYIHDYKENSVVDVTQSAIDLAQTEAVVQALSALGDTLASLLPRITPSAALGAPRRAIV